MTDSAATQVEFSRPISADQIGPQEIQREISANAVERARLAERFGLVSLDRLEAVLHLTRDRAGLIQLRGRLEADLVQACVVTLEPVPAKLAESFMVAFGSSKRRSGSDVVIAIDESDPPEELTEGRIDLGEAVAQQLAVALDPYPRAPGADERFEQAERERALRERSGGGPFAVLGHLRKD